MSGRSPENNVLSRQMIVITISDLSDFEQMHVSHRRKA